MKSNKFSNLIRLKQLSMDKWIYQLYSLVSDTVTTKTTLDHFNVAVSNDDASWIWLMTDISVSIYV